MELAKTEKAIQEDQSELYLVPMVQLDGRYTMGDEHLREVWHKIVSQGLMRTVFWEGHVSTEQEFIDFCKSGKVMTFVAQGYNVVAMAWLAPIAGNHAFGHFCMFKEIWGRRTLEVSKLVFDQWFQFGDNHDLLDVVFGVVPASNERARHFMRKMGMTLMGDVPGLFKATDGRRDDGSIGYITRDEYYGKAQQR